MSERVNPNRLSSNEKVKTLKQQIDEMYEELLKYGKLNMALSAKNNAFTYVSYDVFNNRKRGQIKKIISRPYVNFTVMIERIFDGSNADISSASDLWSALDKKGIDVNMGKMSGTDKAHFVFRQNELTKKLKDIYHDNAISEFLKCVSLNNELLDILGDDGYDKYRKDIIDESNIVR
jgi:hypothetical protein